MSLPKRHTLLIRLFVYLFIGLFAYLLIPPPAAAQSPTHAPVSYGVDDKGFFIKDKNTGVLKMRFDFSTGYLNVPMRSSTSGGSGNLVQNNGFENGTDTASSSTVQVAFQWDQTSLVTACTTCVYTLETSNFGGSRSISLYTGNSTAGSATASIASSAFEVQPNTAYTAMTDLSSNAALTNVKVQVAFYAGDASTMTYSNGYNSAGTYGAVTDIYTSASFNNATWGTYPNSTGISITAPASGACGGLTCTLARIFIQHQGTTANASAKLFVDNVKFGLNLTQSNTNAVNSSYISSGAFGSNTGNGNYSFPGNVGIGTTGPGQKLEVSDSSLDVTNLTSAGATSKYARMRVTANAGNVATTFLAAGTTSVGTVFGVTTANTTILSTSGSGSTQMLLGTETNIPLLIGTNNLERVRITNEGNVGIGTTAPGYKLDVAGTARLTDDLYLNGGQYIYNTAAGAAAGGFRIEESTTNLVTNPSFEGTMDWENSNGNQISISKSSTAANFGNNSLLGGLSGVTSYPGVRTLNAITVTSGQTYTFSGYFFSDSSITFWPIVWDGSNNQIVQGPETSQTANSWNRFSLSFTPSVTSVKIGVSLNCAASCPSYTSNIIRLDGIQLEQKTYVTAYVDGSLGAGYAWTGTAHASTSTRAAGNVIADKTIFAPDLSTSDLTAVGTLSVGGATLVTTNTGNVGIGTTGPLTKLHVASANTTTQSVIATTDSAGNSGYGAALWSGWSGGTPNQPALLWSAGEDLRIGGGITDFGAGTGFAQYMVIKDGGNVGIGTTGPNATLDVNGYIKLSNTTTASSPAIPTCDSTTVGVMLYNRDAAENGAVYVCGQASGGTYAWGKVTVTAANP